MDEICVPIIKKILGHYLELNPDYNNGVQRNQQPNGKVNKRKKYTPDIEEEEWEPDMDDFGTCDVADTY